MTSWRLAARIITDSGCGGDQRQPPLGIDEDLRENRLRTTCGWTIFQYRGDEIEPPLRIGPTRCHRAVTEEPRGDILPVVSEITAACPAARRPAKRTGQSSPCLNGYFL